MASVMEIIVRGRDQATKVLNNVGDAADQVATKAKSASQKMVDVGGSMQDAGKKASLFATVPIVAGMAKMTGEAESLNESINAVNVVFGEGADKIHEFGKVSADQAGLSARAFNELVTPVGAALQNVGFGADEAADASINLAKRAADMASVFNVDVDEALGAIQAGLRGEADPLERFGVGLSAAAVEAHALSMGLAETTVDTATLEAAQVKAEKANKAYSAAVKEHGEESIEARDAKVKLTAAEQGLEKALEGQTAELTDAQKAQARLDLLMKQSESVAGDFTNTIDGTANAQRHAAARAEDLAASFGQKLLPVKAKMIELANGLLDRFEAMSPQMQTVALVVAGVVAAMGPLVFITGSLIKTMGQIGNAVSTVIGWFTKKAAAATTSAATEATAATTSKTSVLSAIGAKIAATARWVASQIAAGAKAAATMAATAAKFVAHYVRMAAAAAANAARMAASWVVAMGPVGWVIAAVVGLVALIIANWDKVKRFTKAAWDAIRRNVVDPVVSFVATVIERARSLRDKVVGFFTNLKQRAIEIVKAMVTGYIRFVLNMRERVIGAITGLRDAALERLRAVLTFITELPGKIAGLAGRMVQAGASFMGGMWEGITSALGQAASFVGNIGRGVANAVIGFVNDRVINSINRGVEFRIEVLGRGIDINPPDIPRIPSFHGGGQFRAPRPGGEGLALLRDREHVFTPEQMAAGRGGGGSDQQLLREIRDLLRAQRGARGQLRAEVSMREILQFLRDGLLELDLEVA